MKNLFLRIQILFYYRLIRLRFIFQSVFTRVKNVVQAGHGKLYPRILSLKQEFIEANTKKRLKMVSGPILILTILCAIPIIVPRLMPPEVAAVFPEDKSTEVEQTTPIEISFDRSVNRDSVEKNLTITPVVSGEFEWRNNRTFVFTPLSPFVRGKTYTISFRNAYSSSYYIPTLQKNIGSFTIVGNPRIVFKAPEIEAPESRTPITVIFSQPMRPLSVATGSAIREKIFSISPEISGVGKWVGTTAYQFTPDNNYKQATTYSVSVTPNLTSQDGYRLDRNYSWSFSGVKPRVIRTGPEINTYYSQDSVAPTASISAYFNLPPNPQINLRNFFVVTDSKNNTVRGTILLQGNALHFRPENLWSRGGYYSATIKKGFTSSDGPNGMDEDYKWNFTITPPLSVASTDPQSNENDSNREADISIRFNAPLVKDSVNSSNFSIDPPIVTDPKTEFATCEDPCTYVNLHGKLNRLTSYKVTVKKDLTDKYGSILKNDYTFSFKTGPVKTDITLVPSSLQVVVVNQAMPIELLTRTLNAKQINYTLYKINESDFLAAERSSYSYSGGQAYTPNSTQEIKTWKTTIEPKGDEYIKQSTSLTDSKGKQLVPGYYFLRASIQDGKSITLTLLVSRSTLTVKRGQDKLLVWATDQSTGQTISGMKVRLADAFGSKLEEGTTNADGVAILKAPSEKLLPEKDRNILVLGSKNEDVTVTGTRWSHGIGSWDFGLPYYNSHNDVEYPTYIVLDRPLYRPGQEVMYKGIMRKDTDGAFQTITAGENVQVTVVDARGRQVHTEKKQLTGFGTFSGKFKVSQDGNLGYYSIKARYANNEKEYSRQFQVEEYKRPDFKVAIKPEKTDFVSGENLRFKINASYYFGSPIKNAATFYTAKIEDYYFRWDQNPQYEFGQPDSYWYRPWYEQKAGNDRSLTEVNAVTGANGDIDVTLPINMGQEKQSKRIIIDAAVTDINNKTVGASEEVFLHKSGIYVGVKPRNYVGSAGSETFVDTVTLDPNGNSVPKRQVSYEFFKISWVSAREENSGDGSFYYRNTAIENSVAKAESTSDEQGFGSASFVPADGGTYKVVVSTTDDKGNSMLSNTYFWVSGSQFESTRENHDRIPLVTDKYEYERNENAKLFISTPYGPDITKTLITFERNSILDYKVIDVDEKNITYTFPVNERMVPNIYIGAVLMRGSSNPQKPPEFKIGYTEFRVTDKSKKLQVNIRTDKDRYSPRDTVKTSIEVKDAKGNPKASELSLALVDRSLLDLAALTYDEPYKFFFEPRSLGIDTSQSLTFSLNRLNANVNSDSKGGDGLEQSKLGTKRKYFPETDYWNAHIVTDRNGKANINIPLADNLTTWKFTAVANTQKDAFGMGTKEILATKDVLLRPVTPRFLAVSDQSQLGAILANNSNGDLSVDVSLKAPGLSTNDPTTQRIQIAKGEQANVLWKVLASGTKTTTINITAKSQSGKILDDIELLLPIVEYHTPETTATAGNVTNQKTEKILLPKDVVRNRGSLDVVLSSSILGSTIQAMSYLIDYPYGCTEQTTSRFYPAIPLYTLMKSNNIKNIDSQSLESLKDIISLGVQKLQNEQKSDGGWGWWVESRESDPFLTAYAYQALSEAKVAGLGISDSTLNSAESYLVSQLGKNSFIPLDAQSYIVRVLKKTKKSTISGFIDNIYDNRIKLTVEGKAHLLVAMYEHGSDKNRRAKVKDELMSLLKKSATGVHWEDKKESVYTIMGNDMSSTASVLEALLIIDPANPIINDVARYFQANMRNDSWLTTRSTSAVLHALVMYTKSKGDFGADYNYTATINGAKWQSGKISKNDMGGTKNLQKQLSKLHIGKPNSAVFTKSGKGNLYYTMNLHYFLPYSEVAPLDQGITIIREYEDMDGNKITNNRVKASSMFKVKLTIVVNETRHKLIIEDKLPAGIEANNENLKGSVATPNSEIKPDLGTFPLYYDRKEYRDDRVVFFTNQLPPGVYEASYYAHATTLGKYHRPPAQSYEMYMPDIMGHTDGGWFEVVK